MPREPAFRNTCHCPRTSLPQHAFHPTDHVQQDIHPTDKPLQLVRKSGSGKTRRRVGRRRGRLPTSTRQNLRALMMQSSAPATGARPRGPWDSRSTPKLPPAPPPRTPRHAPPTHSAPILFLQEQTKDVIIFSCTPCAGGTFAETANSSPAKDLEWFELKLPVRRGGLGSGCVFITAVPITKLFAWWGKKVEDM